ncbi:MAG: type VI secretion system baseplate subunit TssG [Polyangiales bacterium]
MESDARTAQHGLSALFGVAPGAAPRLGFHAALRRIECAYPTHPRLGESASPDDEPVRLGQPPSLGFTPTALISVLNGGDATPGRLNVGFFGLFGPHGALPLHLTEYAQQRLAHHGDATLAGFADVFHHRLLSLLHRAWANVQPTVNADRPERDRYARYLGAFVGQETRASAAPPDALDHACLFAAVHCTTQTRHAEGLAKLLEAFFEVGVAVEEFIGDWLRIPDDYQWRLPAGDDAPPLGALGVLGESSRVGTEVWDHQAKFRVVLGPLGRADYEALLPGGARLAQLVALVGRYAGPELAWDVRLVLREPDRRAAVLGLVGALGRTAHLGGGASDALAIDDLVLDPLEHAA